MARVGTIIFVVLNSLYLIAGLSLIVWSTYLAVGAESECFKMVEIPMLALGILLTFFSLLGLLLAFCTATFIIWAYIIVAGAFALGFSISSLKFEHSVDHMVNNFQDQFLNKKNWGLMKACLKEGEVCKGTSAADRTSLREVCCKPPSYCGLELKNATSSLWELPKNVSLWRDPNCMAWNNRAEILCYDCQQCKEGVHRAMAKYEWGLNLGLFYQSAVFLIIYFIGGYITHVRMKELERQENVGTHDNSSLSA